jgi:hypothetical protein
MTKVSRESLKYLASLNCDHVISGDESQHCNKNDNELKRGACCNSCWVRRWAKGILKGAIKNGKL